MTRFAIDAQTLLHLAVEEIGVDPAHQLVASNAIRSQALTLLLADVNRGALDEPTALRLHETLTGTKMRLLGDRVSRTTAWKLARQHGWDDLVDAETIAVCMLQADALVTIDPSLAARAEDIVTLAPLDALVC